MNEEFEGNVGQPEKAEVAEKEVKDLFDRLNPRDQVDMLMLILMMPQKDRPADTLTIAEREEVVMNWAMSPDGPGLEQLSEKLNWIIQRQG